MISQKAAESLSALIIFESCCIFSIAGQTVTPQNENMEIVDGPVKLPKAQEELCKKNPCGQNAECLFGKLFRQCRCFCGYFGNPITTCSPIPREQSFRFELDLVLKANISSTTTIVDASNQLHSYLEKKVEVMLTLFPKYIQRSFYFDNIQYVL